MMDSLAFWINLAAVVLMPVLIFMIRHFGAQRQRESMTLDAKLAKMHEDNQTRLERIENGLLERIGRLEGKIDGHLGWHIGEGRHIK